MNALIRFHYGLDPTLMTDEEYAKTWNDLKFCLTLESDLNQLKALGNG